MGNAPRVKGGEVKELRNKVKRLIKYQEIQSPVNTIPELQDLFELAERKRGYQ
jgi:hypothetical protein